MSIVRTAPGRHPPMPAKSSQTRSLRIMHGGNSTEPRVLWVFMQSKLDTVGCSHNMVLFGVYYIMAFSLFDPVWAWGKTLWSRL